MEKHLDLGGSRDSLDGHLNTWQTDKEKRLANTKAERRIGGPRPYGHQCCQESQTLEVTAR